MVRQIESGLTEVYCILNGSVQRQVRAALCDVWTKRSTEVDWQMERTLFHTMALLRMQ